MKDMLLFVDVESSGLEPDDDILMEVGVALVHKDGRGIESSISFTLNPHLYDLQTISEVEEACTHEGQDNPTFVRDMHRKSGLIDECCSGKSIKDFREAENLVAEWMSREGIPFGAIPMAGSNVPFDRGFLKVHLPTVEKFFHYRNIDVSGIKELCRMHNPPVFEAAPPKLMVHRSIPDIKESIIEYKHYVDNFLFVV